MVRTIETQRLILKSPELSDLDNLLALRRDPEVMRYIGSGEKKGSIQTVEQVKHFLAVAIPYQKKYGYGFCSVFEKETGDFVGQAGLFHVGFDETQPEIELAYRLHKKYWGRGYATELARALIRWGFEHLSVERLVALIYPENKGSCKVLEKAGMSYTGKVMYGGEETPCYEIYRSDSIGLVDYNPLWPEMAREEIAQLRKILPKDRVIDIQHIGSTAIPGMAAKPVIDIQIAVDSLAIIRQTAIDALKAHGYAFWEDNPDPERMFFAKGMPPYGTGRTHHVHIVEPACRHWQEKILFRDYLIAHPEAAGEYSRLKATLARQYTYDREGYTDAKKDFINDILIKAGR